MAHGSMRQRGKDSWELRVYQGIGRTTGRQRWITKTVHGTQRFARRQLEELVAEAGRGRLRASTLADLLEQWFEAASPSWAATTVSHTRSNIDCHLKPDLDHLYVAKLTTEDIDDFYGHLLRRGGRQGRPLAPGTVTRIHGVLHRALAQAVRWEWIWSNPATNAMPPRVGAPVNCGRHSPPSGATAGVREERECAVAALPETGRLYGRTRKPAPRSSVVRRRRGAPGAV